MRRADPPVVSLADTECAAAPTYPDSDVGSSPRSFSAHGGRPGSLTEDPPPTIRWDDAAFTRVKLMCSYGGRILPRPHDNQLRYVGGDSRIAVVSRGISFSELTVKLSRMFGTSVAIKYQLPYEDLDALISVTSDEDLDNMMEEYDRLQNAGVRPSARLRLFLFPAKLERSQTASLSELMDNNNQSRERWFVDILNGLQVLPYVRSETSSIVSESPDYLFQSNTDSLEEWAAAASYGNTAAPPYTEQSSGNKQEDPISAAALFGSLLQHTSTSEATSAPGSPSPLKHKQLMTGSSSSAPPAVITLLSALAEAASKGLPTLAQHVAPLVDGSTGTHTGKSRLGSGDGSIVVPEQRKHVDGEVLLTSDKEILTSSAGSMEQPSTAGVPDDNDAVLKLSATGSSNEVSGKPQNKMYDAGITEPLQVLRGELASENPVLMGQPIFDEEMMTGHLIGRNLNVSQLDESVPSPIMSPSGVSSASALSSPVVPPQQPISAMGIPKVSADDKSKQQAFPVSPRAGARLSSEDKMFEQMPPPSVPLATAAKSGAEDVVRQVSPSLAHFLPTVNAAQQVPNVVGEDTVRQVTSFATKAVEMTSKPQPPASVTSGAPPPSAIPPAVQQPVMQKAVAAPSPNYVYQAPALEVPMSADTHATQASGIQLPNMLQTPSGVASNPAPQVAAPFKAANVAVTTRPIVGTLRPHSPQAAMAGNPVSQVSQIRPASPPVTAPPIIKPPNIEALKGYTTNMSPPSIFSSFGEPVKGIPAGVYSQVEAVNVQRQASDPLPSQRMASGMPQPGSQFSMANLNTGATPGIPTRFRGVVRPMQQVVAEGFPIQQAPVVGIIADKKAPVASQRAVGGPSTRPPVVPGVQYSYYGGDQQPNVVLHPATVGGTSKFNSPTNVAPGMVSSTSDPLPFAGANPFADNFQPVSTYQDVLEVPSADQQQRRQMRP